MAQGLRILVVEDEPETRRAVRSFLEFRGHTVVTARSGSGAVEKAEKLNPDMLICDWKLGEDDGVEVIRRLKSRFDIPVVMVTAHSLALVRQRADERNVEVAAYRRKPVSLTDLANLVETLAQPS